MNEGTESLKIPVARLKARAETVAALSFFSAVYRCSCRWRSGICDAITSNSVGFSVFEISS